MSIDEQDHEIAEMVRERRQAMREQVCLQNKLQRMRHSIGTLQLWLGKGVIIRHEDNYVSADGEEPIECFTFEQISSHLSAGKTYHCQDSHPQRTS